MSSTITQYSNLINVNFPVPGADNDTQGFRSNFSNIQSSLNVASREISYIQANSVNLSETNDFGYNVIKRASFQNCTEVVNDAGTITTDVSVDYALGSYQTIAVSSGTFIVSVNNWPDNGQCGNIKLEITPDTTSTVTIGLGGTTISRSYNRTKPIIWELWSTDGGTTVKANELTSISDLVYLPRYTTSELSTISAIEGTMAFNTTLKKPVYYANGIWNQF